MPPSPHFKVNFDASVSTVGQVIGIGVVVRGFDGHFIAGLSKKLRGVVAPDLAEALAAREACSLAKVLMIPSFVLEGDLSSVIALIRGSEDILSDIGLVIQDVRLALLDQNVNGVEWTPRDANKVAHELAHFAKTSDSVDSL